MPLHIYIYTPHLSASSLHNDEDRDDRIDDEDRLHHDIVMYLHSASRGFKHMGYPYGSPVDLANDILNSPSSHHNDDDHDEPIDDEDQIYRGSLLHRSSEGRDVRNICHLHMFR